MSNFELIDDYLTNRLSEGEKEGFDKQLESDPALKAAVDLQRSILEGIKSARAAQLKAMLNNVPVPSGQVVEFTMARMAASIIGAGVIGAAIYFYFQPGDVPSLKDASADFTKKGEQVQSAQDQTKPETTPLEEVKPETSPVITTPKEEKTAPVKTPSKESSKEATPPKLEVADLSDEMNGDENKPGSSEFSRKSITTSHVDVETDTANKRYSFHYQFASGKLFLYGPFDKNLYEILEINSDAHSVFLFYNDNYYLLDEKQIKITHLEPISDQELLKKLKAYRGK